MRIRTQFILSMALFGVILAAISGSVIVTNRQVEGLARQGEIAANLERDAAELSYLWNDYLLYQEDQQRLRWESKFAAFSADVSNLKAGSSEQQALVDNIIESQRRLKAVFGDVASALEGAAGSRNASTARAFLEVSWSRMAVQNQALFFDASRLSKLLDDEEDELSQRNTLLILALVMLFGSFFLANYLIVYRRALRSIAELREGTTIIGSGNLEFAMDDRRKDEIGDLARAFNRMTADLRGVTASKTQLETEIALRKRAEVERARLLAAEQEARAIAEAAVKARDDFISVAAHELRTPVTSLQGFAQLVKRDLARTGGIDPGRLSTAMERIERQSKRLTKLTEQLLNVSRLQTGKVVLSPERVDLSVLVKGVVDFLQQTNPGRTLVARDSGPAVATVDPLRMEQVLTNLLDNALKFSPERSPIEVEVDTSEPGVVGISVRDHGIGIPEEKRARIFERFYQAHPEGQYGGMGIGLSVSHQIVEMHGGTIAVETPEGGGSRFIVRLPRDAGGPGGTTAG